MYVTLYLKRLETKEVYLSLEHLSLFIYSIFSREKEIFLTPLH